MRNISLQAWRVFLEHGLKHIHWGAVASIFAIVIYQQFNVWIGIAAGGCLIYLGWKNRALALSFIFVFVLMWTNAYLRDVRTVLSVDESHWTAELVSMPNIDGNFLSADFLLNGREKVHGTYIIKSKEEKESLARQLKIGMRCFISGDLEKPDSPSNFKAFDYQAYLEHKGIYWLLQIEHLNRCSADGQSVLSRVKQIRQDGIIFVNTRFPDSVSGLVNALVFGERSDISADLLQAYQSLGLVHLLAVSGLHVGVVMGICYYLLLRLGVIKEHVHVILLFLVLPLYVILTGLSPSVLRAALMFGFMLLSPLVKLKLNLIQILSASFLLLLIVNPHFLFDIGFQLSFLITFSIIVSAPAIQDRYKNGMLKTFMMTGIAQTAAVPIILYHFYGISLLSFFLNVFYIPFISFVVLPVSILSVILVLIFPASASVISHLIDWFIEPAHALLLKCQQLFIFNIITGRPSEWAMAILILAVFVVLIFWENGRSQLSALLPVAFLLVIAALHFLVQILSPYGSVTFLDVGQGDSILIRLPHAGGTMLIDTGGRLPFKQALWEKRENAYDIGRDVVAKQLKAEGVGKIDWLVLTHRDWDHIGGLNGVLNSIKVDSIIISREFQATELEQQWFDDAKNRGIKVIKVPVGLTWGKDPMYLKVLWPNQAYPKSNNRSLVIQAKLGGQLFLFTGDLEKEGEEGLLKEMPNLHADVLKAGHHGSRTSSSLSFIQALNPKLTVISVGKNNRFGHPHEEVLDTYRRQHIPILRTDRDGAIKFIFTEKRMIKIIHAKNE
ncbi:MAG: DNA internalization-related competence protein ComEC/Rec2 [Tuberibacillus sp.]